MLKNKENFNASIKQEKEYLSWSDNANQKFYDDIEDYLLKIDSTYDEKIVTESDNRIYKFRWSVPLYGLLFRPLTKDENNFSGEDCLTETIKCYKDMLEYCEDLFNPEKELYSYFPFWVDIKKGSEKPYWLNNFDLEKHHFKDQKIYLKREKNIITFEWYLPDSFESIELSDDLELYNRIFHSTII
jgi:hypothetical protein